MDAPTLKSLLDRLLVDPTLRPDQPEMGNTHCNGNVRKAANFAGFHGFDDQGLLMDDMIKIVLQDAAWRQVPAIWAAALANFGVLVLALMSSGQLKETHGHGAPLYPGPMQQSGSLGRLVPLVANVGKVCEVMPSSRAFPPAMGEAGYWGLLG